jgi:phosphinothricin acetyltransferase
MTIHMSDPNSNPSLDAISVAPMEEQDWPLVRTIYAQGIATGDATFEASAPEWEQWNANHILACRLVARSGGNLLGWAALSPMSSRCVYAGVAEVSIYIAEHARGRKIGTKLLRALVDASEREGIWTLQAGIFTENVASIHLHENCGFTLLGIRKRLGRMDGRWRDVVLMERRSERVGID